MRAFVLCHDDIWTGDDTTPGVSESLIVDTGENVTVTRRDWDGFEWGPPYEVEVGAQFGGYQHIGHLGQWGAYVLESSGARLQQIDNQAPDAKWVPLFVLPEDDTRYEKLNTNLTAAARTAINNKLTARGMDTIPTGWSNKQMLRKVFARFEAAYDDDMVLARLV